MSISDVLPLPLIHVGWIMVHHIIIIIIVTRKWQKLFSPTTRQRSSAESPWKSLDSGSDWWTDKDSVRPMRLWAVYCSYCRVSSFWTSIHLLHSTTAVALISILFLAVLSYSFGLLVWAHSVFSSLGPCQFDTSNFNTRSLLSFGPLLRHYSAHLRFLHTHLHRIGGSLALPFSSWSLCWGRWVAMFNSINIQFGSFSWLWLRQWCCFRQHHPVAVPQTDW